MNLSKFQSQKKKVAKEYLKRGSIYMSISNSQENGNCIVVMQENVLVLRCRSVGCHDT